MLLNSSKFKVGIFIPTKDRPDLVIRLINYYQANEIKHSLYIGDSSNLDNSKKIKNFINENKFKFHLKYYYWPEKNEREVQEELPKNIVEDYCAYSGDDDYLVPKSLVKCAEFLSHNKDFRTAQGNAIIFQLQTYDYIPF